MTQNVVTYTVVVTTENKDGRLYPYMTANVNFEIERHDNVLKVPNAALRWKPRPAQIAPDIRGETLAEMNRHGDKSKANRRARPADDESGDEKAVSPGAVSPGEEGRSAGNHGRRSGGQQAGRLEDPRWQQNAQRQAKPGKADAAQEAPQRPRAMPSRSPTARSQEAGRNRTRSAGHSCFRQGPGRRRCTTTPATSGLPTAITSSRSK